MICDSSIVRSFSFFVFLFCGSSAFDSILLKENRYYLRKHYLLRKNLFCFLFYGFFLFSVPVPRCYLLFTIICFLFSAAFCSLRFFVPCCFLLFAVFLFPAAFCSLRFFVPCCFLLFAVFCFLLLSASFRAEHSSVKLCRGLLQNPHLCHSLLLTHQRGRPVQNRLVEMVVINTVITGH